MPVKANNVRGIVLVWLQQHEYDGLYCGACGCENDDLMPCGQGCALHCQPGYRTPVAKRRGWVFIGPDKARTPAAAPYPAHPDPESYDTRYGRGRHKGMPLPAGWRSWMTKKS